MLGHAVACNVLIYPEHRILITINQLPIFLIDFDLFDFFDYIDYIDFELIDFCIDFFFDLAY